MREIFDHAVNAANEAIKIQVTDEPGAGGANHVYEVRWPDGRGVTISFQNGPIAEKGVNGLTQEVLLAIVIDRLRSFQAGPFACEENHRVLSCCEDALTMLKIRTSRRLKAGVEGTHEKAAGDGERVYRSAPEAGTKPYVAAPPLPEAEEVGKHAAHRVKGGVRRAAK
jgi:hypothetical protein